MEKRCWNALCTSHVASTTCKTVVHCLNLYFQHRPAASVWREGVGMPCVHLTQHPWPTKPAGAALCMCSAQHRRGTASHAQCGACRKGVWRWTVNMVPINCFVIYIYGCVCHEILSSWWILLRLLLQCDVPVCWGKCTDGLKQQGSGCLQKIIKLNSRCDCFSKLQRFLQKADLRPFSWLPCIQWLYICRLKHFRWYISQVQSKDLDTWWSGMESNLADILSGDDLCNYFDFIGNFDDRDLFLFVKTAEHLCTLNYHCRLPTDTATHNVTYASAAKLLSRTGEPSPLSMQLNFWLNLSGCYC